MWGTGILRRAAWLFLLAFSLAHGQERNVQVGKPPPGVAAPSGGKVALVIGNGAYPTDPLRNPVNDARAMAERLGKLGFEVVARENLGRDQMQAVVRDFGRRMERASIALFYFAGHGMQVKGRNYLIPVDASIEHEDEVAYRSFDASEVLDKMESARTRTNLVILDACRNNPFQKSFRARRQGLAEMEAPGGTLIAFATAPGAVALDGDGDNGVYTKHVLRNIEEPMPVEQMFKRVRIGVTAETRDTQIPWESSSLREDFSFRPAQTSPALAGMEAETVLELAFWDAIKASSNVRDYAAYLQQYPRGRFAALARVRIEDLAKAVKPAPVAEAPRPAAPPGTVLVPSTTPLAPPVAAPAPAVTAPAPQVSGLSGVGFSADGKWIAAGSAEGSVNIVNVSSGFVLKRIPVGFRVGPVGFSPDGSLVVAGGSAAGDLAIVDVTSSRPTRIPPEGLPLVAVAFSPDSRYLLSGAADGPVVLRSTRDLKVVRQYGPAKLLRSLQYGPDGRYIAWVQGDGAGSTAKVVDVASGREVLTLPASAVSFSVNGRFVLLAARGNVPTLVEIASGREVRRFPAQETEIARGTYSEDGTQVATLDRNGLAVLWGTLSGEKVFETKTAGNPRAVAFSPDARTIATVDADGKLGVHRLKEVR